MKVLFIGNSHTYMNDMPELTRRMLEDSTGQPCLVTMLETWWNNPGERCSTN